MGRKESNQTIKQRSHVRLGVVLETYVPLVKLVSSHLRQFLSNTYVISRFLKYGVLYPH